MQKQKLLDFLKDRERHHALMTMLSGKNVDIRFQHLAVRNELYSIIEMIKQVED